MNRRNGVLSEKKMLTTFLRGLVRYYVISGLTHRMWKPMFSYDFIIVREILPEKGYLFILKEYVVVKSMFKFRLFILENHLRNYLQFQTLYSFWRNVHSRKLTLVWDQNVLFLKKSSKIEGTSIACYLSVVIWIKSLEL